MSDLRSFKALLIRRALAAKATPGPWAYGPYGDTDTYGVGFVVDENDKPISGLHADCPRFVVEPVAPEVFHSINAAYIAANSPDVVMDDIDEILRLRATVERLEKEADWLATQLANAYIDRSLLPEIDNGMSPPDPHQMRDAAHDAVNKSEKIEA